MLTTQNEAKSCSEKILERSYYNNTYFKHTNSPYSVFFLRNYGDIEAFNFIPLKVLLLHRKYVFSSNLYSLDFDKPNKYDFEGCQDG